MAIIKKSELKSMKEPQLKERLNDLKKELIKINAQVAMGTVPENPGRVREVKKTVARINTLLNQQKETKEIKEKPIKNKIKEEKKKE